MTRTMAAAAAVALCTFPALAEPPQVAADIPPVHSLVARVMQGVGEPELILPPGASPHGYAMRPSEAASLAGADVVVWVGDALTPWLGRTLEALAPDAVSLELLGADGTTLLGYRAGGAFAEHDRDHDHGHDQEAAADGHAHAPDHFDPHAWLDPENAIAWLDAIAAALAEADPANAEAYARNAADGAVELAALTSELSRLLAPLGGSPFIVFHDAYRYFEERFRVEAAGSIALGDAAGPGPARIAEIREALRATGARCVFAEPQFAADLIDTVIEGTGARAAVLDPLGASLAPGPDLYPLMIRDLAESLRHCLTGSG